MAPDTDPLSGLEAYMPVAHAVMEAGGTVPPALTAAIAHRIVTMLPGQVLEVVSLAPTAASEITSWCLHSGHELLAMLAHGDESAFWIRKRE